MSWYSTFALTRTKRGIKWNQTICIYVFSVRKHSNGLPTRVGSSLRLSVLPQKRRHAHPDLPERIASPSLRLSKQARELSRSFLGYEAFLSGAWTATFVCRDRQACTGSTSWIHGPPLQHLLLSYILERVGQRPWAPLTSFTGIRGLVWEGSIQRCESANLLESIRTNTEFGTVWATLVACFFANHAPAASSQQAWKTTPNEGHNQSPGVRTAEVPSTLP